MFLIVKIPPRFAVNYDAYINITRLGSPRYKALCLNWKSATFYFFYGQLSVSVFDMEDGICFMNKVIRKKYKRLLPPNHRSLRYVK